ncbi:hypothetical protein KPL71_012497 [Citrus sinensis]|uniref:Uncharacterized protein n=1 Tax=Citrus sinensis TaxID=2711 RepID=A0ACB8LC55_CITSI|nr:hypothetical protein KPL71_012497 [Citrus sinensis]
MAPEYATRGHLTEKADVYSFEIVALEIEDKIYLLDWVTFRLLQSLVLHCLILNLSPTKYMLFQLLFNQALVLKEQGNLMELVDTDLGSNFDKEQLMVMINVALLCASASPTNRPSMSSVLSMLECGVDVPDLVPDSRDISTSSIYGPPTRSSTSGADLYPCSVDSDRLL